MADAARLTPRWQIRLPEGPQWPAGLAAADGFLLVGLRSDALAVIRPADGVVQATLELDDEVTSPPLVHGGQVWVTTRDGALSGITWPSGSRAWTARDVEAVGLTALGQDVLVSRRDGGLERWGRIPSAVRWRAELSAPATTPPTVLGTLAFVGSEDGWLHAVDLAEGKQRFKVEVGPMVAPSVGVDRLLLVPTRAGELHAFDVVQHEVAWTYDLEGECWGAPAVGGRHVYVASWGDQLHALSLRSGDDVWTRPLAHPVTASPVLAGGTLYVVTEGGELLAYEARSGRELGRHRVAPSAVQASALPLGDAVIVAALDGTLTCLG